MSIMGGSRHQADGKRGLRTAHGGIWVRASANEPAASTDGSAARAAEAATSQRRVTMPRGGQSWTVAAQAAEESGAGNEKSEPERPETEGSRQGSLGDEGGRSKGGDDEASPSAGGGSGGGLREA